MVGHSLKKILPREAGGRPRGRNKILDVKRQIRVFNEIETGDSRPDLDADPVSPRTSGAIITPVICSGRKCIVLYNSDGPQPAWSVSENAGATVPDFARAQSGLPETQP
jgi:hypothetical protein